jgi:hypothetical protein
MIFLDTETCGLHGMAVLLQYAIDDGPIILYELWNEPIEKTLRLIESFCADPDGVVGFNLAFDWFHLCKIYTIFRLYYDHTAFPVDDIQTIAYLELDGRDGPCLKPAKACDLMLHARKGPYQSTMDRHDIRIKRVPTPLAWQLADELEKRIKLKDIYFARRKDKTVEKWSVRDRELDDEEMDPNFKDVVLSFAPSSALKALATDIFNLEEDKVLLFTDIEINKKFLPEEVGYAPYWAATSYDNGWPGMIQYHIDHWATRELARQYAVDDVKYTRNIWRHFGHPDCGDDDSELACMVAACRWRGYALDVEKIKQLKFDAIERSTSAPTAPASAKRYIWPFLSESEQLGTGGSTGKVILEEIAKWKKDCPDCEGLGCEKCSQTGEVTHPASERAKAVIDARKALKEIELFDKLIQAGRFHASFKVIGTLSSRMAGADGLNPQGIKKTKEVRSCFPLAFEGYRLCGGDFKAFEVVLAEATYNDPKLREDLLSGLKIHALFGEELYPDETYESILASEGTEDDKYSKSKSGVFSQIYGGDENTLKVKLGIDLETGRTARENFERRYPGIGAKRKRIFDMFCSMRQPGGIGSRVVWTDPKEFVESLFGFRRYFTLENAICKALFDLAEQPPISWKGIKIKVIRRDRQQTCEGATRSALFGAAFAIQSANMRAAANHEIQSSGAQITKYVQRKIWDLQPSGVNNWIVQPMNIHDEILTPTLPEYVDKVEQVVKESVEFFKPKVPLIGIDWFTNMKSWAEKKG